MAKTLASWQAPEFERREKSADWYWAVWIIVVSVSVIAILFQDTLLAVLIIIGACLLTFLSDKPPRLIQYEITDNGISVASTMYLYESLDGFGIEDAEGMPPKLLVKSKKLFMPILTIPIRGIHTEEIRQILDEYLTEEKIYEPMVQKIIDFLGF